MIVTPRIENVIKHCEKYDIIYSQQEIDSKDRWTNRGWLEALRFVQQNYKIERM